MKEGTPFLPGMESDNTQQSTESILSGSTSESPVIFAEKDQCQYCEDIGTCIYCDRGQKFIADEKEEQKKSTKKKKK